MTTKVYQVLHGCDEYSQEQILVLAKNAMEALNNAKLSHPSVVIHEKEGFVDVYEVAFDENGCDEGMYIGC